MDGTDWVSRNEEGGKQVKKILNTSMIYFILAIIAGVFYREFTKYNGFSGKTTLGYIHAHLFVLGMILFLIIALFCNQDHSLLQDKMFKRFFVLYNISLPFMACTMLIRGIIQVQNITVTNATNSMIAGIAGVSHILITISLFMLFIALKKKLEN